MSDWTMLLRPSMIRNHALPRVDVRHIRSRPECALDDSENNNQPTALAAALED
jgi:hypothetical protein